MILQRNEAQNSRTQSSILKALLKYRDFIARVEDESPSYIMPNHVLFAISKFMPTTKNEFRDCCRANFTSSLMKIQDQVIKLVS